MHTAIAQLVERTALNRVVVGSSPTGGVSTNEFRLYGVVVSTQDFESCDAGSSPARAFKTMILM